MRTTFSCTDLTCTNQPGIVNESIVFASQSPSHCFRENQQSLIF